MKPYPLYTWSKSIVVVLTFTLFIEEHARVFARRRYVFRNVTQKLYDMSQVILVPRIVLTGMGFKQIITRRQFESLRSKGQQTRSKRDKMLKIKIFFKNQME